MISNPSQSLKSNLNLRRRRSLTNIRTSLHSELTLRSFISQQPIQHLPGRRSLKLGFLRISDAENRRLAPPAVVFLGFSSCVPSRGRVGGGIGSQGDDFLQDVFIRRDDAYHRPNEKGIEKKGKKKGRTPYHQRQFPVSFMSIFRDTASGRGEQRTYPPFRDLPQNLVISN